ncbi:AMP-binding protein [Thalassovita taeanensis]|uniref:Acyl-CoA synthetase (AMP-forming)/AMP-acid ligase II n=1 Tax=Thalassovita taeanensis TaxID=657014 RepID=A0A1H9BX78_9RHOB|nr:AMP-binding protein [Thalassovita taeanensis]SEP93397.1 Acyl-CoA synthetase (AMP-forming)/AMP-acid ligase II [Thalassovita taeanensis]
MSLENISPWKVAEDTPDKVAILFEDTGGSQTYGQMVSNANRLANHLISSGLKQGDCISIFLENNLRYLEVVWAAKIAGLYYVCIGRQLNAPDVSYVVQNSLSKVLISSAEMAPVALEVAAALNGKVALLMMDGATAPYQSYEDAVAAQPDTMPTGRVRGASMLYTSGTTGRPKGVRHDLTDASPHTAPPRHTMLIQEYGYSPQTVFLNLGPFYHTGPLRIMMHAQRTGATVVGFKKFNASRALAAIGKHRVTFGLFVPTMFVRFLALPETEQQAADTSSLTYALHIAAPCSIAVKERMIEWWGPIIYEMYGGTESIGTTTINSQDWLTHKGSVGRASLGTEVHIVGEDGQECPPNTPGLVYLTNGKTFEYFNDPGKTDESRHPKGWNTLGDIGKLDEDGFLYLTDRKSNLIISGGVNIYPQESENVLTGHPMVRDVAVIGVPNPDFGEEVKALVVPNFTLAPEYETAFADELIDYCRSHLSKVKCPRSVDFVPDLPRSEAGKILKAELRKTYWPEGQSLVL